MGSGASQLVGNELNRAIAAKLREVAELLAQQGANPFRVNAYRHAADTVDGLAANLDEILEKEGIEGLVALPTIGSGVAGAIREMIATGQWSLLERLRGTLDPVHLFQSLPGVGPGLARRIHDTLHVDTLEALEAAAYDGRLRQVEGIGDRRLAGLRATLSERLGRRPRARAKEPGHAPGVDLLLQADKAYHEKAGAHELPLIAPKRFNPEGKAWLPVLHTMSGRWHLSLMYSNTARAHQLRRTNDWVVVYYYNDHHEEGQCTVVTETHGPMEGLRVVRGQEDACRDYYRRMKHPHAAIL
ncbi:MAG: helix-hairpin-helix domain-containing protein [Pseudomonadota bacterium]